VTHPNSSFLPSFLVYAVSQPTPWSEDRPFLVCRGSLWWTVVFFLQQYGGVGSGKNDWIHQCRYIDLWWWRKTLICIFHISRILYVETVSDGRMVFSLPSFLQQYGGVGSGKNDWIHQGRYIDLWWWRKTLICIFHISRILFVETVSDDGWCSSFLPSFSSTVELDQERITE